MSIPSFDPRPRVLRCAVTGREAPIDVYNTGIEFPREGVDADLLQALRHLDEDWVFVRATRLVPNPEVEAMIEAQSAQARAYLESQGAPEEAIEAALAEIDDNAPEAWVLDTVEAVISPEGTAALAALGLSFDDGEDVDDEGDDLPDGGDLIDLSLDDAE